MAFWGVADVRYGSIQVHVTNKYHDISVHSTNIAKNCLTSRRKEAIYMPMYNVEYDF